MKLRNIFKGIGKFFTDLYNRRLSRSKKGDKSDEPISAESVVLSNRELDLIRREEELNRRERRLLELKSELIDSSFSLGLEREELDRRSEELDNRSEEIDNRSEEIKKGDSLSAILDDFGIERVDSTSVSDISNKVQESDSKDRDASSVLVDKVFSDYSDYMSAYYKDRYELNDLDDYLMNVDNSRLVSFESDVRDAIDLLKGTKYIGAVEDFLYAHRSDLVVDGKVVRVRYNREIYKIFFDKTSASMHATEDFVRGLSYKTKNALLDFADLVKNSSTIDENGKYTGASDDPHYNLLIRSFAINWLRDRGDILDDEGAFNFVERNNSTF